WFNDIENNNKLVKTKGDFCQLCFRIKQTKELEFKIDSYDNWRMMEANSGRFVGRNGRTYVVSLDDCNLRTISLVVKSIGNNGLEDRGILHLNLKVKTVDSSNVIERDTSKSKIDVGF